MSDTIKEGKRGSGKISRRRRTGRPRSKRQGWIVVLRTSYGSTEKILRRNRKLWTRKFAKEGRRLDKEAIQKETEAE